MPTFEHPLDGAWLRHQRSLECFKEAFRLIQDFQDKESRGTLAYQKAEGDPWVPLMGYKGPGDITVVPLTVALEISEMLYNLKVALDYLMFALFKEALKRRRITKRRFLAIQHQIQFPIKETPKKFDSWRASSGEWLLRRHAKLIEDAQPYVRPAMLLLGNDFHNLDKHRELQPLMGEWDLSGGRVVVVRYERDELDDYDAPPEPGPANVGLYQGGSVEVTFDDGTPVIPTLKGLAADVRALIDAFESYFK